MTRDYTTLLTETVDGHVLLVTLNRPEVSNALNTQMGRDLRDLWSGLVAAPGDVRAVVLTGAGDRAFCAGGDLKERDGPGRSGRRSMRFSNDNTGCCSIAQCR